ncbi:hypothetical protein B0H16DRAFT_1480027 [Mycena metata]|uniref:Uncharacterized protein n=1 Tax=Mycena metata TaxID=1033252 RepID=A0AAD7MDV8_9AGAR|nr:hypothetical protein B0H16DRAFT_1480027 [Mycena metata]
MTLSDLQFRLLHNWRIFKAWRSQAVRPRWVHTIRLNEATHHILAVPRTRMIAAIEEEAVYLHDWESITSTTIPLVRDTDMVVVTAKTCWIDSIGQDVIAILLAKDKGPSLDSEVQLFAVNPGTCATVFLNRVQFGYWVMAISLADSFLMVVGYTPEDSFFLHTLDISYSVPSSVTSRVVLRIGMEWPIAASSFAILDDFHVLLANPAGIVVYKVEAPILGSRGPSQPCWSHRYQSTDMLYRPPLSSVFPDPVSGQTLVSIFSKDFLRRVSMSQDQPPRFELTTTRLVQAIGESNRQVTGGYHTGVQYGHHPGYGTEIFSTLQFCHDGAELHPFTSSFTTREGGIKEGSVLFNMRDRRTERDSLQIDEGEGRVFLMSRGPPSGCAEVVILGL